MFLLTGNISTQAQLFTPLGLGVEKCEYIGYDTRQQMHVEGDTLYVCTKLGLYSKDLSSGGSSWQLVGFENIPIQDYVRSGDDMLALISKTEGKYMLLSSDGGKTYEDVTPETFRKEQFINRLVQHPTDPNTLLVSGSMGLFQSSDFGQTWKKLTGIISTWIGYHPLNPEIIYGCGTDGIWTPFIDISYDGGLTWNYIELSMRENFVGSMAFHPTDPDIWIAGGARCNIFISTDNGHTWEAPLLNKKENELFDADWAYTVYDNVNSDIIYMAGGSYEFELMCSTDGGKTWNIPRTVPKIKKDEGLYDFRQYGDKLLIYTESDVYVISKSGLLEDTLLSCGFEQGESNYVISNKAVRPDGSTDEVKVVTDETGAYYQELLGLLGSDNVGNENKSFLRWKTGGSMSGAGCNPEDASLTLDGFNLESGQRYAVDFTFSDIDDGDMAVGIYHMTPDGLEPVKGPGISPDGSLEYCYHNDHNINRYRLMFMSESDYEDCCLRFSFLSPGKTYEIDNIALLEPVLCDVSYNGDIARIKFTPGNNLGEMAGLAPEGRIEIPAGCVTLEAELNGEPYGLDVMTAEYHKDGYLYIWLDDDGFDGLEKIRLSFRNPVDDPSIALKYIKEINHATNDTVWALMPDLIQQRAFYNPEVSVSYKTVSWLVKSNLYDFKDTGAPSDLDSITMSFRAALAPDFEESIVAQLVNADGWRYSEPWYVSDYIVDVDSDDYETYTVVFRRDSLNNPDKKLLTGNYIFKVENVRFMSACHHIMTDYSVPVYFDGTNSIGREAEAVSRKEVNRHYSPDGRIIPADSPGVHIIRSADGTVHKVLVPYQSFHPSLQSGRE